MSERPCEVVQIHTRLLKTGLEAEDARAYWQRMAACECEATADVAFGEYWFGARTFKRVSELLLNFRARFDAFPGCLEVLGGWDDMTPEERRVICHWHLQLVDPMYRAFAGEYLVERWDSLRPEVTRDLVIKWVNMHGLERWSMATRVQMASKLLSAAYSAGLVGTNRDPRPLRTVRVSDEALTYLMYLLREVKFEGTLLNNPYLTSVGLAGGVLDDRLRGLSAITFQRQGELVDLSWQYKSLMDWAGALR